MKRTLLHRTATAAVVTILTFGGLAACGTSSDTAASTASSSSETSAADATSASAASPDLETLVAEVTDTFEQATYTDTETGEALEYNIYVPADYDPNTSYPVVLYIPDSSLVGGEVTAPLSQYGALIWASESQQAVQESIVVVPSYPEVIIDDHDSYTTTDYVEMTTRLLESIQTEYNVDADRIYGTGQSMGAMTVMYLAAAHPDLFAAEMIVSGQWDITQLAGLADENFIYFAAGGDEKASTGQAEVRAMLEDAGESVSTTELDATAAATELEDAMSAVLAKGTAANFATFATGTVLEASDSSGSAMGGEHMASFQPAYEIAAARTWLLQQTAA